MSLKIKNIKNRAKLTKSFDRDSYWDMKSVINMLENHKNKNKYFFINDRKIRTTTTKNNLFVLNYKKNRNKCKCALCGLEAKYFVLEKDIISYSKNNANPNDFYHFNLYTIDADTKIEIIFNIDHIKPKSKGGTNDMYNLQLTCEQCNLRKGNEYDHKSTKRKLRVNKILETKTHEIKKPKNKTFFGKLIDKIKKLFKIFK